MRNEKRNIKIDSIEIYKVIRNYYELLYDNKLYNLEIMDKFLEKYNL